MLAHVFVAAHPPAGACPPSCPNNELSALFDKYCSDKGTFWQSKHHYGSAYHSLFASLRNSVGAVLEIGIGEDTAPSAAAWADYFPRARIYSIDVKTTKEFEARAVHGGATERLAMRQAKFGCEYNASMWHNRRLSLTLGVDATDVQQLTAALPAESLDLIVDDGSHKFGDQQGTLHTMWPRLRPGGFYIVEDLLVGPLPWSQEHAQQVPTNNTGCGGECFFPQRPAEHPWLFDRFGVNRHQDARTPLSEETRTLLNENDWFWVLTGVHRGGGVDAALVLRKAGPPLPTAPAIDAMEEPTLATLESGAAVEPDEDGGVPTAAAVRAAARGARKAADRLASGAGALVAPGAPLDLVPVGDAAASPAAAAAAAAAAPTASGCERFCAQAAASAASSNATAAARCGELPEMREMRTVLELQAVENEKLLRLLEIEAERTRVHDAVFCVTLVVLVGAWLCSQASPNPNPNPDPDSDPHPHPHPHPHPRSSTTCSSSSRMARQSCLLPARTWLCCGAPRCSTQ